MGHPQPSPLGPECWSLPAGALVAERYEVVREIGRGGMGAVYEALDRTVERPVAIKFLDPKLAKSPKAITRFQNEAVAAGRIGHDGICDVRDRGQTKDGVPYLVMELLEGESLFHLLRRQCRLTPQETLELLIPVLDALTAAHDKGIVHRDLKPENIFVTRDSLGQLKVKLLDFGLSRFIDATNKNRLTTMGKVLGSPSYMSPEQARGLADVDHRTDVWAMGVILYECLTGQRPFTGANYNEILISIVTNDPFAPSQVMPSISPELESVILTAIAKDREQRFGSAVELARALEGAVAASPTSSWPATTTDCADRANDPQWDATLPMSVNAPEYDDDDETIQMPTAVPDPPAGRRVERTIRLGPASSSPKSPPPQRSASDRRRRSLQRKLTIAAVTLLAALLTVVGLIVWIHLTRL